MTMGKLQTAIKWAWTRITGWFTPRYRALIVESDLPDTLEKHRVYIVEESGFQERAALLCPCGCDQVLYLNLLADERPRWRVRVDSNDVATLAPSVCRKTGCESHFWLRQGKIHWCP